MKDDTDIRVCDHPEEYIKIQIEGELKIEGGEIIDTQRLVYVCTCCGEEIENEEPQPNILF